MKVSPFVTNRSLTAPESVPHAVNGPRAQRTAKAQNCADADIRFVSVGIRDADQLSKDPSRATFGQTGRLKWFVISHLDASVAGGFQNRASRMSPDRRTLVRDRTIFGTPSDEEGEDLMSS